MNYCLSSHVLILLALLLLVMISSSYQMPTSSEGNLSTLKYGKLASLLSVNPVPINNSMKCNSIYIVLRVSFVMRKAAGSQNVFL